MFFEPPCKPPKLGVDFAGEVVNVLLLSAGYHKFPAVTLYILTAHIPVQVPRDQNIKYDLCFFFPSSTLLPPAGAWRLACISPHNMIFVCTFASRTTAQQVQIKKGSHGGPGRNLLTWAEYQEGAGGWRAWDKTLFNKRCDQRDLGRFRRGKTPSDHRGERAGK